jgi:hypothetical protein
MAEPVGMTCPGCGQPPMMAFEGQAFCGNEKCRILTWNPTLTMDENLDDYGTVELPPALLDLEGGT